MGSRLLIPVNVEGALYSVGDAHFAQGDGEICGTAIEASLDVTLRLSIADDVSVDAPLLLTPSSALDARTLSEIQRTLPPGGTVHLLGGPSALAPGTSSVPMGSRVWRSRPSTPSPVASHTRSPARLYSGHFVWQRDSSRSIA